MKVTAVIGVILLIGIYYYVTLPAINIHASEFWMYLVCWSFWQLWYLSERKI